MVAPKHKTTAANVRARLAYDPTTGIFLWKLPPKNRPELLGKRAGRLALTGYRNISIDGQRHQEHRLAWLYVFGEMPKQETDHINGNRADNRIENLRPATRGQNNWNICLPRHNTSGFKGVGWSKAHEKWIARIGANNKKYHLGYFVTVEAAAAAYAAAAKRLHGEFARAA